jgi:hypothetical protein
MPIFLWKTILYIKVTVVFVCLSGQFPSTARTFFFFFFDGFCFLWQLLSNWQGGGGGGGEGSGGVGARVGKDRAGGSSMGALCIRFTLVSCGRIIAWCFQIQNAFVEDVIFLILAKTMESTTLCLFWMVVLHGDYLIWLNGQLNLDLTHSHYFSILLA